MARDRIKDKRSPSARDWEEFYRNRGQCDKVVRSAHGVNCTGGCSWMVSVKDGIVAWELQADDYPPIDAGLPGHEPRGCPRGASFSWYLYSPLRVKHPYVRGALLDLWADAKDRHADPVEAWRSIVENPESRRAYTSRRGMGGLRRAEWDEAVEIIAAATVYTAKKHGPDRVIGFTPIPAMSMVSYAAGTRFLQLLGGVCMSFYDWYCDLPPASPQVWGEQTDVNESADWCNAGYIVVCGSNPPMTRTPDAHFLTEARYRGAKVVVLSSDYSQASKFADEWVPVEQGHDGAFWMAVNHVILKECYVERKVPRFDSYARAFTDLPFLVTLEKDGDAWLPGDFLRASEIPRGSSLEHGDWILCVADAAGGIRIPRGSLGFRWCRKEGDWNLDMKDAVDGEEIDCPLTLQGKDACRVRFRHEEAGESIREVPALRVVTNRGEAMVATVFDLLAAQLGVSGGAAAPDRSPDETPFTPEWQEKHTGIPAETVSRIAREWAENAEKTGGRNLVITGAGINHWYHNDLTFRAIATALVLTGSVGRNGAGLAHYVGQEKVVPLGSWTSVAMAQDWVKPSRLQNTPSFWYIHSDQWRYDRRFVDYNRPRRGDGIPAHAADFNVKAVRLGWMPFAPHFNESPLQVVEEARRRGAASDDAIRARIVERLRSGSLRFAVEDPDAPENFPRVWFIWRANAISASAKGHEYFLKHVVGAPNSSVAAREAAKGLVEEVRWREPAPEAKTDLIVDLNFRMDTSTLYSDIVLPAATWYEKRDLNTTDMHSFINGMDAAVPPAWQSRTDWRTFGRIAEKFSELAATHFPAPVGDVVSVPLLHDTPGEIAQREVRDWKRGECEAVPGRTMPNLAIVARDYVNLHRRFVSLGPGIRRLGAHGVSWEAGDVHQGMLRDAPTVRWGGDTYVSLEDESTVIDVLLAFAPETNGELGYRAYRDLERRVGKPLAGLVEGSRAVRITFDEVRRQPRRYLGSPVWSGIVADGRPYAPYTLNVERGVPWRTLSGRQQIYLDHPWCREFGEALPTFKERIRPEFLDEIGEHEGLPLRFLTPHGKWSIHSTYGDNLRMLTLSRGGQALWLNARDAEEAGIADNEWVEIVNANGVMVSRAVLTSRIPRGSAVMHHAPERTLLVPKSETTGKRGGVHNSLSRIRLKPTLMLGGYAQLSYYFNYWGPTGVNRDCYVVVRKRGKG